MLLNGGPLRVIHVTTHVSMREACDRIKEPRVYTVIRLAQAALQLLGLPNGKIGVARTSSIFLLREERIFAENCCKTDRYKF